MEQLKMKWETVPIDMPSLPDGCYMRSFKPGDEEDWCRCCIDGELGLNEVSKAEFNRIMAADEKVEMRNIYFLVSGSHKILGTITYQHSGIPGEAVIHMVGIIPSARGKGLARYMMCYAMKKITEDGNTRAFLTTDDWRIPGIKAYFGVGFTPVINDDDMQRRWDAVMSVIQV